MTWIRFSALTGRRRHPRVPARRLTSENEVIGKDRVIELDQQLFETKESLRRTTEELEAARSINRELMQQANRPQP